MIYSETLITQPSRMFSVISITVETNKPQSGG